MTTLEQSEIPALKKVLECDRRNIFFLHALETCKLGSELNIYKIDEAYIAQRMCAFIYIYAPNGFDKDKVLNFLSELGAYVIIGIEEQIQPLADSLDDSFIVENRSMMTIDRQSFKKLPERNQNLRELFSPEDYEDLYDMYQHVPEFSDDYPLEDKEEWALMKAELEYPHTGVGLYFKNKMISGAYLLNATKNSASIVGVATDEDYQGIGAAKSVVSELVDIALNENNIDHLCLWYNNEKAKHIYTKLGFKPIGNYINIKKRKL